MKNIKSFDCISTAKYGIALNTFFLILAFPFAAIIAFNSLNHDAASFNAFLLQYSLTFMFSGIFGGALEGFLFGLTYNFLSPYLEPIQAELEETEETLLS
jgi:hypothetical protein